MFEELTYIFDHCDMYR